MYKRKTRDEWELQGFYHPYGYETLTTEETRQEALEQLKCYRENEPHTSYRIVKKRVRYNG